MDPVLWQPWLVGAVLVTAVILMVRGRAPDIALLCGLVVVMLAGVIDAGTAIRGFGNEGLLTVAALFVVAAGMQNTGTIRWLASLLLRSGSGIRSTLANLCIPTAFVSAFLNNTPIVAVLTPATIDFAKRQRYSPSKLLMPLCFATTLGGTLTLIGTSTNLVVAGLVESAINTAGPNKLNGLHAIGFFEITRIGLPLAIIGVAYLIFAAPKILPQRIPVIEPLSDPRQYTARLEVAAGGPLDGRTIAEAKLRRLDGLFLVEIQRTGDSISAPGPDQRLRGNDTLVFAGAVEQIVALRSTPGLNPDGEKKTSTNSRGRLMIEAVISNSFPGLKSSIREFGFRARYDAAVIAVARNGERVTGRIGDIILQVGDTLLLEANESFLARNRSSRDFFLVSGLPSSDLRPQRAVLALSILIAMIGAATYSGNMLAPSLAAAVAMVVCGCLRAADARASIDISILLVIGAGLGLSNAVEASGLGASLGQFILGLGAGSILASLAAVYLVTAILTNLISNAAAAAIVFPLAVATATQAHTDPMPFVLAVLFAASAAFATPIGYQTNLMIYGPGGYRFSDFVRFGLPLNIIAFIITISLLAWQYGLWTTT
ncbi:MAG: SLC13 family permease [Planctomycetota bacterium]|nr:SLC13 family permease [Planctomycetota bacterium]